jgi:aminopeptidase N
MVNDMLKLCFLLTIGSILMMNSVFAQTPPLETGVSQTLAKWRAAHYSDVRYKLNITLEKGAPLMKGEIEIRLNIDAEGAKSDLILDWRTTAFANDKDKPFANVITVNATGAQASRLQTSQSGVGATNQNDGNVRARALNASGTLALQSLEHLIVPKALLKTGENVIKIKFASPIKTSGAAVTRYVDKEDGAEYVYSLFVPSDASTAIPVFDQPDLKAKFSLALSMPEGWRAVSNTNSLTKPRATEFGGRRVKTLNLAAFEETKPISTYVFAFAAGDFEVFSDKKSSRIAPVELAALPKDVSSAMQDMTAQNSIYVRKSQAEKFKPHMDETFRLNREAVKYLENYFDFKYPFPKYDLVLIPEFPFNGMEHAGATFIRESSIIFPSEPTKNDFISRANVIFHEAAHQWFGDTVTMKWFDDLWLKEGFAEFMAYKTLEKTMPEYNAWKAFYERNKPLAYLTDSTKGTTPIYQEIPNLSSAKSAYGNIVYRKAPSFLKQAEFYLGEKEFQTAVRAFLKKYQYKNAEWTDLVAEFETAAKKDLKDWANKWVTKRGMAVISKQSVKAWDEMHGCCFYSFYQRNILGDDTVWRGKSKLLQIVVNSQTHKEQSRTIFGLETIGTKASILSVDNRASSPFFGESTKGWGGKDKSPFFGLPPEGTYFVYIPNYQDYGYGIFLLDEKSRAYVLANIRNETDDFLRSMMWGALWDSVREAELNPKDYVELAIKNIDVEKDELTIQTILSRVSTAMNYYVSDADRAELAPQIENLLIEKIRNAPTTGQRITFYRAFLNVASSENARAFLKGLLLSSATKVRQVNKEIPAIYGSQNADKNIPLKTKDKFDIVTRLAVSGDADAAKLLEDLSKTETSDDAKRYAYAVGAAFPNKEAKEKYFGDFLGNKEISESWIESAFVPFNSPRHSELTLPFLEKALAELPNLKRNRKIFFVNGWLASFIGGQKDEKALAIVNKFLSDNPNLDKDLRLKILENVDVIERSVKIRGKYEK